MAAPYLTGNVLYAQLAGVLDVQTIINQVTTMATTLSPAWTNPMAGKLVSPPDGNGRQFTIQFNRISATNLEMVMTDGSARTMTRRAQINAGGSAVDCYVGQFHMILDWLNGSTPEGLLACMLDESPELQTSHNMWMVGNGSRNTGDSLDSFWQYGAFLVIRNAGTFAILLYGAMAPLWNRTSNNANNGNLGRTIGGSNLWVPLIAMGDTVANVFNIYGKVFACLGTRLAFTPPGAEVSVPVDQANSSIFRVLNMPTWNPGVTPLGDVMAVRKT